MEPPRGQGGEGEEMIYAAFGMLAMLAICTLRRIDISLQRIADAMDGRRQ